jgi:hypothetical protein
MLRLPEAGAHRSLIEHDSANRVIASQLSLLHPVDRIGLGGSGYNLIEQLLQKQRDALLYQKN